MRVAAAEEENEDGAGSRAEGEKLWGKGRAPQTK